MPFSSADPNAFLAIGMQSALGTPQVTAAKLRYIKYLSGNNLTPEQDIVFLREGGDGLDWGSSYQRQVKGSGNLVMNARPEAVGAVFQALPGGATWSGASTPATHIFHSGHASFPYLTVVAQHPGSLIPHLFADTRLTSLSIEGNSGEPWRISAPFTSITPGASFAALTPTYGLPGTGVDAYFMFAGGSYVVDGAADTKLMSFKIDYSLGVDELQAQGPGLDDITIMNRDLNIEFTRRVEDATLWKKIYYEGGVAPSISVATGSFRAVSAFDAGANLRQLDINCPLIAYNSAPFTDLDPDGQTVMMTVSGKVLKGATHALVALLANGHASVYGP